MDDILSTNLCTKIPCHIWLQEFQFVYHQPVQLKSNTRQPSFLQKVIQNMGLRSDWVPDELFDVLIWPDCSCNAFKIEEAHETKVAPPRITVCII